MSLEGMSLSVSVRHRVWSCLPDGIRSSLDEMLAGMPDRKIKGRCLSAMITTAALVEGVVTDALEGQLESMVGDPEKKVFAEKQLKELNRIAWAKKKELAGVLSWDLGVLACFEMVEMLFSIRNNLGHGRSYKIKDARVFKDQAFRRTDPVHIENELYQKVYLKLHERGLLPPLENNPGMSVEIFLTPEVARFFFEEAILFLRAFLDTTIITNGDQLKTEFEESLR